MRLDEDMRRVVRGLSRGADHPHDSIDRWPRDPPGAQLLGREHELPALVRGGVTLAPVLLRPCLHEHADLGDVQWAHDLRAGALRGLASIGQKCGCSVSGRRPGRYL